MPEFMPKFFGCFNVVNGKKTIRVNGSFEGLPCGVYSDHDDLTCWACNGTGGEEISGGHKKECEKCLGSGIDPISLYVFEHDLNMDEFIYERRNEGIQGSSDWILHSPQSCPECKSIATAHDPSIKAFALPMVKHNL